MGLNNNVFKRLLVLILAVTLLTGCSNMAETVSPVSNPINNSNSSLDDLTITDKPEYYSGIDSLKVETLYLTVRKGNSADNTNHTWTEINSYSTYYYDDRNVDRYKVEATLQAGDKNGPQPGMLGYGESLPNATVQVRGKTTSQAPQKSYQIKIKPDKGTWHDQKTIILNKHPYDPSRFRNKVSYDLMIQYPELFGAHTTFVHLYVKDLTEGNQNAKFVSYGLYTHVEQFNSRYLRNHGLDANGHLYKASMFEFYTYDDLKLKTDSDYDVWAFEQVLEIKGNDDHKKLIDMIEAVNDYAIPIEETFEKYFDETNYFSWLAFQLIIGNRDIMSQNFFLYSPLNGNKWYFIPWDCDGAWSHQNYIAKAAVSGYNYTDGISNVWGVVLHQRVLKSPALRQKLLDKVEHYYKDLKEKNLKYLFKRYADVVYTYLYQVPDINYALVKQGDYYTYVDTMTAEIDYNYQMIQESLQHPMPYYCNVPEVKNGKLVFGWDNAYDFDSETITYTLEVAKDYLFKEVIFKEANTFIPQVECKLPPDGQYFLRITAKNQSGKTQTLRYSYQDLNDKIHYGVATFYIEKGQVLGMEG